jgi:hypothetical protein
MKIEFEIPDDVYAEQMNVVTAIPNKDHPAFFASCWLVGMEIANQSGSIAETHANFKRLFEHQPLVFPPPQASP